MIIIAEHKMPLQPKVVKLVKGRKRRGSAVTPQPTSAKGQPVFNFSRVDTCSQEDWARSAVIWPTHIW